MGEPQRGGQVERLSVEMQATALKLQEITSNLQSYLREQGHIQEDVTEVRSLLRSLHQLLMEGSPNNPSLVTQIYYVQEELKGMKAAQLRARDWWLKLVATVAAAAIITLAGVILMLWASGKGGAVKP